MILAGAVLDAFDIPVVLVFFNRSHLLSQVWEVVQQIKPGTLIAISDGPRSIKDVQLVEQCRQIVQPDWPCEFVQIYREQNLGCRTSLSSGVSEVFRRFETAIVLEDDCVPHPGFFAYARELLKRFASDERVFSIAGTNQFAERYAWDSDADYTFSRYFNTWGWAAWRRSWQQCDWSGIPSWDKLESHIKHKGVFEDTDLYWKRLLQDSGRLQRLDAWGYQALLTGLSAQSYTVVPRVNMVSNIGLDSGVHFTGKIVNWKLPKVGQIGERICHAELVEPDDKYDSLFERRHFDPNPVRRVLRRTIWGG